nr:reverse transcriptase domain-containing protein [Tanacetum cinerariifolium]
MILNKLKEIRICKRNLALIAKYFKKIYKPTNNNLRTSSNSKNKNVDNTPRYKNDNQSGQFRIQRTVNVAGARENVGSPVVQQSGIQCFNCKEFGHLSKECRKPKGLKTSRIIKKRCCCVNKLRKVQNDIGYNVFANELQHSEQSESIVNTCVLEMDDSNVILDSPDMCDNDIQNDQNDVECEDKRVVLANLTSNLKLDVDENKKIQKQLNKANTSLAHELEQCKSILAKTSKTLEESNSVRDSCLVSLQTKQIEFEKYMACNERIVNYDKLKHHISLRPPTAHDIQIRIKTSLMPLALKTQNDIFAFFHELKQEMRADLKYVESLEKEIHDLESDVAEFSNIYTILQECVFNDVMCTYLHSLYGLDAHTELQCLYLHKVKKCDCLALMLSKQAESVSKEVYTKILRSFAKLEKHSISLELALQECQELMKNDTVCKEKASNVFQKEWEQYFKIQDLKAQLHDKNIAISELKKLIDKCKEKSVETKFDKPFVIVQLIIFIVNSGCTKHTIGNLKLLCKFVEKYLGTVHFGNDQFLPILSYGDLVQGNITINSVYYVEGLNHNLFSVGQFCDADLEDVVIGFPKLKYVKDQLCSSCEVSKAKRSSFKTKTASSSKGRLNLLHMALCGPMRASINRKKYILMKEKGDHCILVGYSTQSKGYHVYKKRTRLIVESMHLRFDEIKEMSEMSVSNDTSGTTVSSQQELDLLFGPLYDEFFNAGTSRVNKSSSPTANSKHRDTSPTTNIQSSTEPINPTNANAEENNDNQAEHEIINPFCTPVHEVPESSSHNIDTVMSDSEDSTITYIVVSSPFRGLSDIGSPGVDGPPVMPEDPYAYVPLPAANPDEDPEEDPANYPTDEGDKGDDEDESSDDDKDDDIDIEGNEEEDESSDDDEDDDIDIEGDAEEDEYLAPADSIVGALPAIDHAPSAEETEPFETDESAATPPPHPAYRITARMSIRPQTPISLPSDTEIARFAPLGYRAARLRWRDEREEIPEVDLPLRKRSCTAYTGTYDLGESSAAAAARLREPVRDYHYMFMDIVERGEGSTPADMKENQDDLALQRARVNRLFRDMKYYAHTARLIEGEATASCTAWAESMDASDAARSGVIALRTQVSAQRTEITDLRTANRIDYSRDTAGGDLGVAGSKPQAIGTVHTGTNCNEVMSDSADCSSRTHSDLRGCQNPSTARGTGGGRTIRANPATTTTTTTYVTDAQLEVLIEQGVAKALVASDADRNTNGDDCHVLRTCARRTERVPRECTYPNIMKCQPLNFKGTEGVVKLTQCALTWWNSHVMTIGPDVAYAMTYVDLKKKMTDKYCPRGEMKKLKNELENLRESDKNERYVGGLLDVIHESVVASRPKTMQEEIEMENELMEKRNNTWAERQAENKRKFDDTSRNNQSQQQQQNKRQNTGRAYTTRSGEKKPYGGSKPLCPKCNYHHDDPCALKCHKRNKVGHFACDCRSTANINTANNQRINGTGQKPTCYECRAQGNLKRDCPKLKNNNRGTQGGNATPPAKVYAVGRAGTNPDSNVVMGERKPKKGQNRIKKGQKQEAWQNREKSEAVTVDRGRKTKENAKRRDKFPNSYKVEKPPVTLRLYLFPHSMAHHATAWFDRLPRNSINTFEKMAKMFLENYFPPSMVTKLRNEITNFRQHTFYNGLTLRHRNTINAAAALKAKMVEINKNLMRVLQVNQQVKAVTPSCETYGGPHSFNDCPAIVGQTQNVTKDTVLPTNNGITKDVQPPVVQTEILILNSEPVVAPIIEPVAAQVSAPKPNQILSIPYPSRLHDQKLHALILMPKFGPSIKSLLTNKDKLYELARTPLNEHCSAILLKELPEKLGDPDKFLIQCDFLGMAECLALADLGASINLMPLSMWNKLSLSELTPTLMTLELADRFSANYNDMMANQIDVIDMACEEYSQEVLSFSDMIASGNPTPYYDPIVSTSSPTQTPFGNNDFLLEEVDAFLALEDDVELKDLPPHLEYAFLEGDNKLPVIITKDLSVEEKTALITVLKSHKRAIAWKLSDIKEKMLKRCEDTNLCLNWEKSHFMVKEGIVLGHKISKNGIEVDKAKVDVIAKLPHPTTVKGIRSFLGHVGFYRRFIQDFSKIARPMTRLLEKDTPFFFSKVCVEDFQTLKRKLTKASILIAPDWDLPFELMCDASDFAIGAVLGQRQENHFRPIHYASKMMTEAESNYTTTEKEMLVVVYTFKNFRSYLIMNKSIVYTDHSALKYLFAKKDSKARLLRWVLLL